MIILDQYMILYDSYSIYGSNSVPSSCQRVKGKDCQGLQRCLIRRWILVENKAPGRGDSELGNYQYQVPCQPQEIGP